MDPRRTASVAIAIGLALGAAACGSSDEVAIDDDPTPEELAYAESVAASTTTTTLLIDGAPDEPLPAEQELLVHFEANWVCELQRRTFATPAAMAATLDEQLAANGLTLAEYEGFRAEVSNSQELRDWILYVYQEGCRA